VIPAAISMVLWGVAAFALCPILQLLIIDQAVDAPNLGSTLNQSAFNLGNALGAGLGGAVVASGANLAQLPWVGAASGLMTLLTAAYFIYRQPHWAAEAATAP
jgi:DHA1 family inner membrane transport protein